MPRAGSRVVVAELEAGKGAPDAPRLGGAGEVRAVVQWGGCADTALFEASAGLVGAPGLRGLPIEAAPVIEQGGMVVLDGKQETGLFVLDREPGGIRRSWSRPAPAKAGGARLGTLVGFVSDLGLCDERPLGVWRGRRAGGPARGGRL